MPTFDELIEEYTGDVNSLADIRLCVRRLYHYDFTDYPIFVWQGQGKLFTTGGGLGSNKEWLGTVSHGGQDHHKAPSISDGRDGSSGTYNFTLDLADYPGQAAMELYDKIKLEQWRVSQRKLTIYLAVFVNESEGLRPITPIVYFKELIMVAPKFSEKITGDPTRQLTRKYAVTISCKDGNFGRSNTPNGTYSDTIQKDRAFQLTGDYNDRGCEFLGLMSNRTYVVP